MADKLPEEFAPTGPKLTRFAIQPPPPLKPHLFADEARFALKLAALAFAGELAFWTLSIEPPRFVWLAVALRLLKPFWAELGKKLPRPLIAAALLLLPLALGALARLMPTPSIAIISLSLVALGLPAVADLCASCIADSVTVERRAAAYSWLEMGQGAGAMLGVALVNARGAAAIAVPLFLLVGLLGAPPLHDRGTPRSAWPLSTYLEVAKSPLGLQLSLLALMTAAFAVAAEPMGRWWISAIAPALGMFLAARAEPRMKNAIWLPRICALLAAAAFVLHLGPLGLFALGAAFSAVPSSVARGAGEMERPIVSSIAWSALSLGVALGAALRY